jgi:membrane fusion protein, multidrug efflux system
MHSESTPEMKARRRRQFGAAAGVVAVLLLVRACIGRAPVQSSLGGAVPVIAAPVVVKDMPVELYAVGTVEPYSTVAVNSQVSGTLQMVHFNEGQHVKKGDALFTIDPAPFEAALRERQANLEMQRAQAENARTLLKRYQDLVKKDFVAQAQYDQARANALSLEASVRAQEAAVENAKLQLGYTSIFASLDGRTGNLLVKPGNLLKANDAGSIMVKILQIHPIYVHFAVPEQYLPRIQQEMTKAPLRVAATVKGGGSELSNEGTLTFVDNSVDRTTGTILLKATFENEKESLWPGQFVDVMVTLSVRKNALVVPNQAVLTGQGGAYLYIISPDSRAINRDVKVDFTRGSEVVLSEGVAAGEQVITDGQLNLGPQTPVKIKSGLPAVAETRP